LDGDKNNENIYNLDNLMFVSHFSRWPPKMRKTVLEHPNSAQNNIGV